MTEENKDVQAQENVNTDEQVSDENRTKSQDTEIDINQLKTEKENYQKAMKTEREKAREYKTKLADYEQKEKERQEKKKLQEGKYQELLEEKKSELQQMQEKLEELQGFKETVQKQKSEQIKQLITEIPDEKRDFVEKVLDGKSGREKIELLKEFIKDYKKPTYSDETAEDKNKNSIEPEDEYKKAKEKGDILEMLNKAKEI